MKPTQTVALAARNLRRHRRRTIITAGAVAVGLMMYIAVDSLLVGVEEESNRNLIWYETGSAQVMHEDYLAERDDRPLKYTVDDARQVQQALEAAGLNATSRIVFSGELIVYRDPFPEDGSVMVTAYGIDPDTDNDVYRLPQTISHGSFLDPGENQALMGAWLAEDIGAEVGYPITVVTRTRHGYYQTIDLEITGIVNTPNPMINRTAIFLPEDVAAAYLQMDGAATEIAVAGRLGQSLPELTEEIEQQIAGAPELVVADWRTIAADVVALAEAKEMGTGIILLLVFIIAAVGVSNTILMSVLERTRELGMMRAIGMRDREVFATLITEAAGIGLIGGVIGMVLGAGAVTYLVEAGIDYGSIMRDTDVGYRVTQVIYGAWNLPVFGRALLVGIGIAVATAVFPVRRALKMSVIESLRNA
ncbi:MAG: FtsX-like permease family protein [Alkalispirochaeta sp.]